MKTSGFDLDSVHGPVKGVSHDPGRLLLVMRLNVAQLFLRPVRLFMMTESQELDLTFDRIPGAAK